MTDTLIDPDDVKDYAFDWTRGPNGNPGRLLDGEGIVSYVVTGTNITVDRHDEDSGVVTVWVSGATARPAISCRIVTDQGRTYDQTLALTLAQR